MQIQITRFTKQMLMAAGVAAVAAGCASMREHRQEKEVRVTLDELSAPARATVERVTAGGKIEKIDKERERGKMVYDVEAMVDGKHMEYVIADADGEVLGTEVPIGFSELPEAVQTAAQKHFGAGNALKAMKCVEYGETTYEIEGQKGGKNVEASFDAMGKRHD